MICLTKTQQLNQKIHKPFSLFSIGMQAQLQPFD